MYQNQQHHQQPSQSAVQSQVQQSYTVQHDFESTASVTATLAHALSDISGADVTDVEYTLEEYVDPLALDTLFSPVSGGAARANGHLTLDIEGYQTTVYGTGLISIVPPQQYQHPPHR